MNSANTQERCTGLRSMGVIYGAALNHKGLVASLEDRLHAPPYLKPPVGPVLFIKPSGSLASTDTIEIPPGADGVNIGAALAAVVGRPMARMQPSEALAAVRGWMVAIDVSLPHEDFFRPAIQEKCRDGSLVLGPETTLDSTTDVNALAVRVFVNETLVQENTTANLVRCPATLLAETSDIVTLYPGDVLLTGEAGQAPVAQAGDRVRVEIDGLGSIAIVVTRAHGAKAVPA